MLGFEPRISGVGSDRSANCANATAQFLFSNLYSMIIFRLCKSKFEIKNSYNSHRQRVAIVTLLL